MRSKNAIDDTSPSIPEEAKEKAFKKALHSISVVRQELKHLPVAFGWY